MPFLLITGAFVLSRAALALIGLPFGFSLDWMWLADSSDLRERLIETLWYFHAFPPGMALITGLLLKIGGSQAPLLAHALFFCLGLVLANGVVALGIAIGLSARAAVTVALAFLLSPPALFFEHLYLYEWPIVTLIVVSCVLFHRATLEPTFGRWLLFFLTCAAIAVTRSTFHLVWFLALGGVALVVSGATARRAVAAGLVPGLLIVLAAYGKNQLLYGEFAASTFGPASFHLVTVAQMPDDERERWMAEGRLSPFAAISPYAPPRDYTGFFATSDLPGWPPQVTRLEHPSVGAPNFNHWFLLEVHRARARDVQAYLRDRPLAYLATVWRGLIALMGPSTEWHPRTGTPLSPHAGHQRVLGGYEHAYNAWVHRIGWPPAGFYGLLPAVLAWAGWRARASLREPTRDARARGLVLAYCVCQVVFVIAVSSMATFLESARYRFQVEPFIWLLTALAVTHLLSHGRLPHRRHV